MNLTLHVWPAFRSAFSRHARQRFSQLPSSDVQVTQLEQNMNFLVGLMFLVQILVSLVCAVGQGSFNANNLSLMWYTDAPM